MARPPTDITHPMTVRMCRQRSDLEDVHAPEFASAVRAPSPCRRVPSQHPGEAGRYTAGRTS